MDSKKFIDTLEIKEKIGHLIIYGTIIFLGNLLMIFGIIIMQNFLTILIRWFLKIFVISRSTEILIVLNFWLGVYTYGMLNWSTFVQKILNDKFFHIMHMQVVHRSVENVKTKDKTRRAWR